MFRRSYGVGILLTALFILNGCASRVSYRELAQEYYNLGNAFFEIGDYETSFEYYSRAIELDDQLPASSYNLARLLSERGQHSEALTVIEELLVDDPENSLLRETYAYVAYMNGKTVDARVTYQSLIDEYPARSRLRYNLALIEIEEDQPGAARDILAEGAEWAQEDAEYQWLAAEAAYKSEAPDEARQFLESYRVLVEDDSEQLADLARRYAEWDFLLASLEILESIPEEVSQNPPLAFLQARLLLVGAYEFDEGAEALRRALGSGFADVEELRSLLNTVRAEDREAIQEIYDEFEIELDEPADSENAENDRSGESESESESES